MSLYVRVTYRQRQPNGQDVPKSSCETTRSGPFTTPESAERYAASIASQTPVFEAAIVEEA